MARISILTVGPKPRSLRAEGVSESASPSSYKSRVHDPRTAAQGLIHAKLSIFERSRRPNLDGGRY